MSELLTLIIGLLFPYLVLSLLGTLITEFVARVANLRAITLVKAIRTMLADDQGGTGLTDQLYSHHLVRSLFQGRRAPPYIPSSTFAAALVHILKRRSDDGNVLTALSTAELRPIREALSALVPHRPSVDEIHQSLAVWFSDVMDRTSGRYQQITQSIVVVFAITVSVGLNIDTILLSDHLNRGAVLREVFVASASELVKAPTGSMATRAAEEDARRLADTWYRLQPLGLPIGWTRDDSKPFWGLRGTRTWPSDESLLTKLIGLSLTALAIILGAPIWFDTLNRVVAIRTSGTSPDERPRPPKPIPEPREPEWPKDEV